MNALKKVLEQDLSWETEKTIVLMTKQHTVEKSLELGVSIIPKKKIISDTARIIRPDDPKFEKDVTKAIVNAVKN